MAPTPKKHAHAAGASEALRLAVGEEKQYTDGVTRNRTEVERQAIAKEKQAEAIIDTLPEDDKHPDVDLYLPEVLKDAVFVGHLVTDMDSVAGAIGAAELYGGVPALASDVNSETTFALEKFGVQKPRTVEEILAENPNVEICLVDHQQTSQMNPSIPHEQVVGIIDHHALQSKTIVTDKPIYIDIRPWGSMSTIVAHTFITHGRRPPQKVAGMLLCAILSDTLNLQGPTTTEWDRLMVAVLADVAGVGDIQLLASQQFKAKSKMLATLSAVDLVNGDQKSFSFKASGFSGEIGFGVVETTDDGIILERAEELLPEMVACKKEKGYDMLFLAVVNIVELHSKLLICGPTELALAKSVFDGEVTHDSTLMDMGGRVSRKKDYIPNITRTINGGWKKPAGMARGVSQVDLTMLGHLEKDPEDPYGNVKRLGSVLQGRQFSIFEPPKEDASAENDEDAPMI